MTSSTYLTTNRHSAAHMVTGALAAALLLLTFARPASAGGGPEPHSSSRIGTGQTVITGSEYRQPRTAFEASASTHWSARIGTGRTVSESLPASSSGEAAGPAHWSARIGTGKASPEASVRKVDRAQVLGEHPAVLAARSWNSRTIDPNTFIVQHPAGPRWVDTPPTAVKVASVSN